MSRHTEGDATGSPDAATPRRLQPALEARIAAGGKCLVPYLTGGLPQTAPADWTTTLAAMAGAGADGIEVGIPFSDPVMDGPVIQEASERALRAGTTPAGVLEDVSRLDIEVPIAVMTYANLVFRFGWERFASTAAHSGVSAVILPDVPLEEAGPWCEAADEHAVETVMLAAPTAPDERLVRIAARAGGFVYAVGLLGITGERDELAASAKVIAARLKSVTDTPVLVGVGIGSPEQAAEVCEVADGVVIGSAVVRRATATGSPEAVAELLGGFRGALDAG